MRWLALFLLLLNGFLFWWFSATSESRVHSVQEGRLFRVSEIKLIGEHQPAFAGLDQDEGSHPPASLPEAPEGVDEVEVAAIVPVAPPVETVPVPADCKGVGWFESEADAIRYRDEIQVQYPALEFVGFHELSEPLESFHWVIIPPLPTREEALDLYRELTRAGAEAYVVPSGEHENAISLGLFRSRTSAEQIFRQRKAENLNVTLVNFPRNRISYALVFRGSSGSDWPGNGSFGPESGAKLQLIEFSGCEGVATAEKNP